MDPTSKIMGQYIEETNIFYIKFNKKIKNYVVSNRLTEALTQVKCSIDELNHMTDNHNQTNIHELSEPTFTIKLEHDCLAEEAAKEEQPQNSEEHQCSAEDTERGTMARGPYRQYAQSTKQRVIELFREGVCFSQIAKSLGIPSKNVIRWCRNGARRKPGAGRKVLDPGMEKKLAEWIGGKFKGSQLIQVEMVRNKAKELSTCSEFFASMGWFKNFMKRYDLKSKYHFC